MSRLELRILVSSISSKSRKERITKNQIVIDRNSSGSLDIDSLISDNQPSENFVQNVQKLPTKPKIPQKTNDNAIITKKTAWVSDDEMEEEVEDIDESETEQKDENEQ